LKIKVLDGIAERRWKGYCRKLENIFKRNININKTNSDILYIQNTVAYVTYSTTVSQAKRMDKIEGT
jgi:hypothetical protein